MSMSALRSLLFMMFLFVCLDIISGNFSCFEIRSDTMLLFLSFASFIATTLIL